MSGNNLEEVSDSSLFPVWCTFWGPRADPQTIRAFIWLSYGTHLIMQMKDIFPSTSSSCLLNNV